MSRLPPEDLLGHILDETQFLLTTSSPIDRASFLQDEVLQRAFVRSLEIIGEAARRLDPEFRNQYPDIEWRKIAGTRDRLIHNYEGVDFELVWNIIETKIPPLAKQVEAILKELGDES